MTPCEGLSSIVPRIYSKVKEVPRTSLFSLFVRVRCRWGMLWLALCLPEPAKPAGCDSPSGARVINYPPMPDPVQSGLDYRLDQLSKIAGILLPLVVAVVGGIYTYEKDANDARTLQRQERRDLQQAQYGNLTALVPLLTSQDPSNRLLAIEIFTSEAKKHEAPLDLVPSIQRLGSEHPEHLKEALAAVAAADEQTKSEKNQSRSRRNGG